jgi:hypothetical protein
MQHKQQSTGCLVSSSSESLPLSPSACCISYSVSPVKCGLCDLDCLQSLQSPMSFLFHEYPHWYAFGTIPTHRPKVSDVYWSSYRNADDFPQIKKQWLSALHSTTSNPHNAWCSQSVPLVTVSTLFPVLHSYLWSSLRSFPIPWPCLLPFHCKSLFHILFYTAYYRLPIISLLIHCLVVISQALTSILPVI